MDFIFGFQKIRFYFLFQFRRKAQFLTGSHEITGTFNTLLRKMTTWVTTFGNNIPDGAIRGGCEADGKPLFVARARIENLITPGKAGFHLPGAHIPYGCKEHIVNQYEVLVHSTRAPGLYEWRSCSNGNIPPAAIATDRNTFIGRVHYQGAICPGKVDTNHRCAYFGYGGKELNNSQYDVLCQIK